MGYMMEVNATRNSSRGEDLDVEEWGDGEIVVHAGGECGAWVKFDPDDPMLEASYWG